MPFSHTPVLLRETLEALSVKPEGVYIDGTAGGGGHSAAIAARLTAGTLISIDQDPDAIRALQARFGGNPRVRIVRANFSNMAQEAQGLGFNQVDGILLDIGVSSHQFDTPERGFSYHADAPLDMRMSRQGPTAADLVARSTWQELAAVFRDYGEEKYAKSIAQAIVHERQMEPVATTGRLAEIVCGAVPAAARREGGHPARRVFQALRIAVNGELDALAQGLSAAFSLLGPGGRLAVITFHSLEDRMVKRQMAEWCTGCTCPPDFPVCVCGKKPHAELLWRKPKEASPEELEQNPRSRSAKLRACIRLAE